MNRQSHRRAASAGPALPSVQESLLETMSGLTDRPDLERLFDRKVSMSQILRLAGKGITPEKLRGLLAAPEPARELRKILGS